MIRSRLLITATWLALLQTAAANDEHLAFVQSKVIPILESRCFQCHKGKTPKGALQLTSRQSILKGGESGPAIVPGKPNESLLIEAIRYEGFEMPPRSKMPDAEIRILEKWVQDGAHWPPGMKSTPQIEEESFPLDERRRSHWAWQPIQQPEVPSVTDSSWGRTDADAFILNRLEAVGIAPAPDADRYTILRRLHFDLTGLPPTPQQIEAFVSDAEADDVAIEKVVDELLASPHFGERWGRHWLDLVRYAETLGHEFDYPLHNAWRYRDYVIRAFNEDVSYDDFVREHIAGDLLKNPRRHPTEDYNESVIGTGFWFLNEDKHSPVDVKGEEASKIDNRIDVFSKTFLGMTVACARCHDHKFDAISTEDYYALAGFLQSSRRTTAWLDPGRKIEERVGKLVRLREQANVQLQAELSNVTRDALSRYVTAAVQLARTQDSLPVAETRPEVLIEDFEKEKLDGWEISGEAFGDGATEGAFPGQQAVTGFEGKRLVNSWKGNDGLQGNMKSPVFTIERTHIEFLVSGGSFAGETCINLLVNGETVRSAVGKNAETLEQHSWDVWEFAGQKARLEFVDIRGGDWGHINGDQFVQVDKSDSLAMAGAVSEMAMESGCDEVQLRRWVTALQDAKSKTPENILSLPATLAQANSSSSTTDILSTWNRTTPTERKHENESELFADLSNGIPNDWFTTGPAFASPSANSAVDFSSDGPVFATNAGVSSRTLSTELRGTLTSPTFELSHPEILIRVAGEGCRVRLVIDGYQMYEFNGLLFNGFKQNIDTKVQDRWIRLAGDVHRYLGHKGYLEFLDDGHGWLSVKEIRFAKDKGARAPEGRACEMNRSLRDQSFPTYEAAIDAWVQEVGYREKLKLAKAQLLSAEMSPEWQNVVETSKTVSRNLPAPIPVIALTEGTAENEHIFIRGSHQNPGDVADRNILTALRSSATDETYQGSGRLQLANQVLADDNPLPARVAVNRIWHHLFGQGIVGSTDNLGVLGKEPTHPKLLDYLASKFRSDGWSVKSMICSIVLSRTYRMSSQHSSAGDENDPTNDLLHRARVRRLTGESVRDAILAVSGRLDRTQFGQPVPVKLTSFMQGRGRPRIDGPLDGNGRRSIYIAVNRNFLSPFMLAFDVPAPVTTIGRRTVSNVPAQALIMLNNEFVDQQSRIWATRLLKASTRTNDVIATAWLELFGRPGSSEDLKPLIDYVAAENITGEQLNEVCHILLNAKQFLFIN